MLELMEAYRGEDILEDMERWKPSEGTPQGAVISPLLANIYLHPLDELMADRLSDGAICGRLCGVVQEPRRRRSGAGEDNPWVKDNGLRLHPDKTHVGDCRNGKGFEFLGYRFEERRGWVMRKSLKAMQDNIRMRTKRTRGDSLARLWSNSTRHCAAGSTTSNMPSGTFTKSTVRAATAAGNPEKAGEAARLRTMT